MNREQITRIAAYGLVVDEGRILLCRLSEQVVGNAGHWTLPGGGIDFGEDPRAAAVREVFEETGLRVEVDELVTVDSALFSLTDHEHHALRIIYRVRVLGGELANEADGSTDLCAWLTPTEALGLPLVSLARIGIELAFPA
jgi:ADP-ribose pyrophosphatase YjhB (NUDIX family)